MTDGSVPLVGVFGLVDEEEEGGIEGLLLILLFAGVPLAAGELLGGILGVVFEFMCCCCCCCCCKT